MHVYTGLWLVHSWVSDWTLLPDGYLDIGVYIIIISATMTLLFNYNEITYTCISLYVHTHIIITIGTLIYKLIFWCSNYLL